MLISKVIGNTKSYDYYWNVLRIKKRFIDKKIALMILKHPKIGKILDDCHKDQNVWGGRGVSGESISGIFCPDTTESWGNYRGGKIKFQKGEW